MKKVFSALLVSEDPFPLDSLGKAFEDHGVALHLVRSAAEVEHLVRSSRFDLIVCDYDTPGIPELSCLGRETRWRGISMVIARGTSIRQLSGKKVHFTLNKPASTDLLIKGLKAAYSTMAHQRFAHTGIRWPSSQLPERCFIVDHSERLVRPLFPTSARLAFASTRLSRFRRIA